MAKKVQKKPAATSRAPVHPRRKAGKKPPAKSKASPNAKTASRTPKAKPRAAASSTPKKNGSTRKQAAKPAGKPASKSARAAKSPAAIEVATPAPSPVRASTRPAAAFEVKPSARRPINHEAPAAATVVKSAPSEPLFPIAPPSGQRDVDLATAIQKSRMFFAGHGLGALASAIPSAGEFPPEASAAIEEAHSIGLDDVFVFPPVSLQRDSLDHLVHRLATTNSDRLVGDQQYGQPWLYQPESLKAFEIHGRPPGAYALCFYSGAFPPGTSGKDAAELREWLDQRRCTSLTVYEYLVLQRLRAEQYGDHRFDLNSKDAGAQWHWLLDMSQGEGKDAKCPMAGWNAKMRRIELGWCGPRDLSPGKGTHATRTVPAWVAIPEAAVAPPQSAAE